MRAATLLRPLRGLAVPAVFAQLGVECGREGTFIPSSDIGFNVTAFAHAGDNGGHIGILKNESKML